MHRYRTTIVQYCMVVLVQIIFIPCIFAEENTSASFQLETITVTAEKQEKEIQKTPSAISVITATELEDADIEEIDEVLKQIPNMNFGETFLGREANFRGIRPSQFTNKNPVVLYIDGILHDNIASFEADLNNIERIEVLRGSQGALYGKSAIGGIVNIISKQPDKLFDTKCSAEFGEDETYKVKAYVDGPIIKDNLFLGLSGSWSETRGFMKNNYPGEDYFDGNDAFRGKVLLNWLPTHRMKVNFHAGASRTRNNNGSVILDDEVRYYDTRDPDDKKETDILNLGLNISYEWDKIEFSSISTFSNNEVELRQNLNYYRTESAWTGLGETENSVFTQEFRFQSTNHPGGLKWLAGIYYSKDEEDITEGGSIMNTEATLGYNKKKDYPGSTDEDAVSVFMNGIHDVNHQSRWNRFS